MTALVVGSKGFLGRHLMAALPGAVGVDLPECDVTHPALETWPGAAFGWWLDFKSNIPETERAGLTVWHLAALNGSTQGFYDQPWNVLETQIRGTLNVIDACVANGVGTLVLFSSSEVFQDAPVVPTPERVPFSIPDPANPRYSYAIGKQGAEALAWWSPIPRVIVVRPFNIFSDDQGPGHVLPDLRARIRSAPAGGVLTVYGHRGSRRAYCHVSDLVSGCLAIAKRYADEGTCREVFNVGNPDNYFALHQLVDILLREQWRDDLRVEYRPAPEGSPFNRCPDVSKLRALGWEPRIPLVGA